MVSHSDRLLCLTDVCLSDHQHPHDTEEHVTEAYGAYQAYIEELMDYYKSAQHVNADQDPLTVAECIESILVNPLPKQPAA